MLPFDEAVFVAHFRRLDPAGQRAFLADVRRAAGKTVRISDGLVVSEGGHRRRLAVPAVGRRDAADRVVDGAELAEMVAYGIPSEATRACCRTHLGAAPADLSPPTTLRVRRGAAGLRPAVRPALALLTLVLLLGAVGLPADLAPEATPDTDTLDRVTEQSVPPAAEYGDPGDTRGTDASRTASPAGALASVHPVRR